jgi:hypothetical protein
MTHVLLQHPSLNVTSAQSSSGVSDIKMKNNDIKLIGADSGWIKFPQISLQDVGSIEIHYGLSEASKKGWTAEVHLDNPQGTLLGRTVIGKSETAKKPLEASLRLTPSVGGSLHDVYFVFRKSAADEKGELGIMNFVLRPD